MRIMILTASAALLLGAAVNAEMIEKTTTTRYSGTIAETSPSTSTIVVKSEDSPKTVTKYIYNDKTVWEDASGKTVKVETVRDQPATILYEKQGDQMIVTKVITQKAPEPRVLEQKTTTTTMTTEDR